MKIQISIIFLFYFNLTLNAESIVVNENCQKPINELNLSSKDFKWSMSKKEIIAKEKEIYESGKRLNSRAYLEGNDIVMPHEVYGDEIQIVNLAPGFIKNISKHVEEAFKLRYIDALIFPDMGHSHLFIKKDEYSKIREKVGRDRSKFYTSVFKLSNLKILYHTAEQLILLDEDKKIINDREVQWRFFTRNLVGSNDGSHRLEILRNFKDTGHNTARHNSDDYRYYGAGFSISGSKNGCFSYKRNGKLFYFDLSFKDLE